MKVLNPSHWYLDAALFSLSSGVISLMSNIVVLLMFVKFKELRTATNSIIINLAFTDIGVAGIGYPMSAASDIHGSWKFGYTGCQVGWIWRSPALVQFPSFTLHKDVPWEWFIASCVCLHTFLIAVCWLLLMEDDPAELAVTDDLKSHSVN